MERSKKCVDFTVTLYILHVLFCMYYDGNIPFIWEWWFSIVVSSVICASLGEFLCSRAEMDDIPLYVLYFLDSSYRCICLTSCIYRNTRHDVDIDFLSSTHPTHSYSHLLITKPSPQQPPFRQLRYVRDETSHERLIPSKSVSNSKLTARPHSPAGL